MGLVAGVWRFSLAGSGKSRVWTLSFPFTVYDQTGAQASDSTNTFIYGTVQPIPSVGPPLFYNNGAEAEILKVQVYS
jgi:hypothetical protein